MRIRKTKTLRNTLRGTMAVLICVPVVAVSVVGAFAVSGRLSQSAADSAAASAQAKSLGISELISEYIAFLDSAVALDIMVQSATATNLEAREKAQMFMSAHTMNILGLNDLLLANPDGLIIESFTQSDEHGYNFRDTDTLKNIAKTPTPVSEFYDGNKRFFVARPILSEDNTVGYIILIIDTALISDYLDNVSESGDFALFDESGNLTRPDAEISSLMRDSIAAYNAGTLVPPTQEGVVRFERNRHYGTVGSIAGTKWRWIALEPTATANNAAVDVFVRVFGVAIALCIINLAIMFRISRNMYKPLTSLAESLEKASGIGVDEPVFVKVDPAITRNPEFSQLLVDYNTVIEQAEGAYVAAKNAAASHNDFKCAYDFLTGLYDRNTFTAMLMETLTQAAANDNEPAVLFVELDNFKPTCAEYGHTAGDERVKFVAAKLKNLAASVSETAPELSTAQTAYAGRFGGGKFALCLAQRPADIDETDGMADVCEAIIEALQEGYYCPAAEVQMNITAYVGGAVVARNTPLSAGAIIARADNAVYLAKKNSKSGESDYYVFKENTK
ncbi:MAG: sensor domain-containing diguanylate cyclase [Oscillospiraceae bacterium]|nr:sensor domain-containing diguanylate cyclase [Oscillospiraceae bacterium]